MAAGLSLIVSVAIEGIQYVDGLGCFLQALFAQGAIILCNKYGCHILMGAVYVMKWYYRKIPDLRLIRSRSEFVHRTVLSKEKQINRSLH